MTSSPSSPPPSPDAALLAFSTFLQLEETARTAETVETLRYSLVNELRRLVEYRSAALFVGDASVGLRIETVSGVAALDPNTPLVRWLQRMANQVMANQVVVGPNALKPHALDARTLTNPRDQAEWAEWFPPCALWLPLRRRDGRMIAAFWLVRERPWQSQEIVMIERLVGCYAHAWTALTGGKRERRLSRRARHGLPIVIFLALAAAMAIPTRQTVLAPTEIVAENPLIAAAPIDGVIARFFVTPNQPVTKGQPLFEFDDTTLQNQVAVAERTLGVAQAELRQATQGAMIDRKQAGQVALLEAQAQLRATELEYARSLLERVTVRAERAGVVVFTDANDWIGRPVATGQRILLLADPEKVEARLQMAVHDAIELPKQARVDLFLHINPLAPLEATLTSASYEAEIAPNGVMTYRLTAALAADAPRPRIGMQGTAKIHGYATPLALYLFRRPLAILRQTIGF